MRVLVSGSRDWPSHLSVWRVLDGLVTEADEWMEPDEFGNTLPKRSFVVVHGDCPTGADRFAKEWCAVAWLEDEPHPANWIRHGRMAGPMRNKEMVDLGADVCVAFLHANSRGTASTIRLARAAGIPTRVYIPTDFPVEPTQPI